MTHWRNASIALGLLGVTSVIVVAEEPFRFKSQTEGLPATKIAATDKRSPWREFVSKEGRFQVEFPGEAIASEAEVETPAGAAKLHLQSVPAYKVIYGAHYLDYPQSTKRLSTKQLLDAARDEAKQGLGGTVLEENIVSRGDIEGREILFDVPTLQATCRVHFFVHAGRLYQVTASGPRDMVTSNSAQRFFKSWSVLKAE